MSAVATTILLLLSHTLIRCRKVEEPSVSESITLIVVPDRGGGESRQYRISLNTAKRWGVGLSVLLGLMLSATAYTLINIGSANEVERLTAETVELNAELHRVSQSMVEVEQMMDRMRLVDAQLQGLLQTDLLPGRGPLDEEEARLLGQTEDFGRELLPGEDGEPMEEPLDDFLEEELGPEALRPLESWATELEGRIELALRFMQYTEPRLYDVVNELEDMSSIQNSFPQVWPVDGRLTSGYGFRHSPISRRRKLHGGIDVSAPTGTPVYATAGGRVEMSRYVAGYGRMIVIDHGYGVKSRYAHNSSLRVRSGTYVEAGQLIATVGSTGQSTGPHLHFELIIDDQRVDPLDYLPH